MHRETKIGALTPSFVSLPISGRDVALSSNQSPVLKFYRSTYTDYEEREDKFSGDLWNVRAMQLWNDWNTQVHEWATRHAVDNANSKSDSDVTVDYLWMRSEDLLPGSPRRLECLHALAEFVGSTLTPEQLCALSQQDARDYGKSVEHKTLEAPEAPPMDIVGRWRQLELDKKTTGMLKGRHRRHEYPPRRRLSEFKQRESKIVPSSFIRDFETWKGLVQSETGKAVEQSKEFVLNGLIGHGIDLRSQWDLNDFDVQVDKLKEAGISKESTEVLIQQLRVKLQETRLYKHKRREEERPGDPNVTNRYGKWHGVLANNTELERYFYQEGAKGLEAFGYHPVKEIHYLTEEQMSILDCQKVEPE